MRWVSKSKLRPKCADGGGGDAKLRDSGQHVDKGDSLRTSLKSHDRTSCTPQVPSMWNEENTSSRMMPINRWCGLTSYSASPSNAIGGWQEAKRNLRRGTRYQRS